MVRMIGNSGKDCEKEIPYHINNLKSWIKKRRKEEDRLQWMKTEIRRQRN